MSRSSSAVDLTHGEDLQIIMHFHLYTLDKSNVLHPTDGSGLKGGGNHEKTLIPLFFIFCLCGYNFAIIKKAILYLLYGFFFFCIFVKK